MNEDITNLWDLVVANCFDMSGVGVYVVQSLLAQKEYNIKLFASLWEKDTVFIYLLAYYNQVYKSMPVYVWRCHLLEFYEFIRIKIIELNISHFVFKEVETLLIYLTLNPGSVSY